jgi:aspartate/methionine/tyrosine aminotransferase
MRELSEKMGNAIHLEQGEPDFKTPRHIVEAARAAMEEGFTHYTSIPGMLELREAIADKLSRENGIDADPTQITMTTGTQEAMMVTALALLDPGEEALILDPYYPSYFEDTLLAEAVPVAVPLNEEGGYEVELEVLERKVTTKTKMIWMCNPSNPTGHVFSKRDLEIVAEFAQKHNLIVFSDEVYEKLVYDGARHISMASLPGMGDRTITVNGFSKAYAMNGWRIGYFVAEKNISAELSRIHYFATMCANTISQRAALAALTGPQDCVREMVAEYDRRRKTVIDGLNKIERLHYVVPKGAFYVFPGFSNIKISDEELAVYILQKTGVVTVPGSGFGKTGEQHLRISYSVQSAQVEDAMKRIGQALARNDVIWA